MQNPWLALPQSAPYVLDEDREAIERFNFKANPRVRIETSILPDCYVGRLDAPVLLLFLNPGFGGDEFEIHQQPVFRERFMRCLRQEPMRYPNYYLDPAVTGGGAGWHRRILKPLIAEFGLEAVARGVAAVEYFPYHSRNFAHHRLRLPSQQFAFDTVRAAIRRDAVIVITRGVRIWTEAVPELATYPKAFATRSVQNVVISARNCPDGYASARALLDQ